MGRQNKVNDFFFFNCKPTETSFLALLDFAALIPFSVIACFRGNKLTYLLEVQYYRGIAHSPLELETLKNLARYGKLQEEDNL